MRKICLWMVMGCVVISIAGSVLAAEKAGGGMDEETQAKYRQLRTEMAEVHKSLGAAKKRLQLEKDPEIVALSQAAKDAQKALNTKMDEKLMADPDAAALMTKLAELNAQVREMTPKRADAPQGGAVNERPKKAKPADPVQ